MKTIPQALILLTAFTWSPAQEKDPFAPPDPNAPLEPYPRTAFVFEILEVERADWLQWSGDPQNSLRGPELRAEVRKWQDAGKARVEHLVISPQDPGSRATISGVREMQIPMFGEPPGYGSRELKDLMSQLPPGPLLFPHFETGLAGSTLDTDFMFIDDSDGPRYAFSLSCDYTAVTREDTFGTGLAESKVPVFTKMRPSLSAETTGGEFLLVNVAPPFGGRNPDAVWLSFVRVDRTMVEPLTLPPARAHAAEMPSGGSILVEWIELSQPDWVAISSQPDEALRGAVGKLIAEGKAAVTETAVLVGRFDSGLESMAVEEFTYVTEYEFPRYTADGQPYQHEVGASYEMRHLGETAHAEPRPQADGTLGAKFYANQTSLKRMRTWGAPELNQVHPEISNSDVSATLSLPIGQSRLISAQPAIKPENAALENPRMLIFARAQGGGRTLTVDKEAELPLRTGRFTLQVLETTQQQLDTWLNLEGSSAAGGELLAKIAPEAKLVETASLTMKLEGQGSLRAIDEMIYPTEYDTCERITPEKLSPVNPGAFDTRSLGLQLKLELPEMGPLNLLRCKIETGYVTLAGLRSYYKGEATTVFPDFDAHRLELETVLRPDKEPVCIGTTRPPDREPGDDAIWAWFLNAEILP